MKVKLTEGSKHRGEKNNTRAKVKMRMNGKIDQYAWRRVRREEKNRVLRSTKIVSVAPWHFFIRNWYLPPTHPLHIKHHKLYPPWTFDRPNIITFVIYRWISRGIRRVCVRTVSSMNDFYCYRIISYNPLRLLILLINDISWKATVLQSREDLDRYQNQWRNVKVSVENWLWNR